MIDKICKNCGKLLSSFYEDGMLGCPDCYSAFYNEILSSLNNYQGNSFHIGKSPKCTGINKELINEYKSLLKQKEQAGIDGKFDEMAEINRDLCELIAELKSRGLL